MLDLLQKARFQMLRFDKAQQRSFRIGIGNNGAGLQLVPIGQYDAGRHPIFDLDTDDFTRGANLGTGFRGCRRHGCGERPRASHNVGCRSGRIAICGRPQQIGRSRTCRPRSEEGAKDALRGDGTAQQLRLEPFGGEVGDCHRSPAQQSIEVFLAQAAKFTASLQQLPQIPGRRIVEVRRRHRQQEIDNFAYARQRFGEFTVIPGIFLRELRNLLLRLPDVAVQNQRLATR